MEEELSIADVILEVVPFSDSLVAWCKTNPEVKASLKFSNAAYFLPLGIVLLSSPKNYPDDEVIGFVAYDPKKKIFKQDHILNKESANKKFILYTKMPQGSAKQDTQEVKHINDFFAKYDTEGGYRKSHHLSLEELEEIADRERQPFLTQMAQSAVERGERGWRVGHSQGELREVLLAIRQEKNKNRLTIA